jgi:hypothetical protein
MGSSMKKQRIQNPRFLAAQGALGFLGLLGSKNPDVQQWAALAWLSLISLLVLIPTVNVESKWANYRLHPRRKGLLAFLPFLGFLGFLGTEYDWLYGLAWLAGLAQFSIDQKKKEPERALSNSLVVQVVIGAVFAVMAVTLIFAGVPLAGMALFFLVFPFIPIFSSGRKERLPLRELRWILVFLAMAIILPVAGITWFMTAAMRNERAAVKQQVFELHDGQLRIAVKRIEEEIGRLKGRLAESLDLSASERFDRLVQERLGDSILIFSEDGKQFAYPNNSVAEREVEVSPAALEFKDRVSDLIRFENWPEAKGLLAEIENDEALRLACDSSGREILPALQLFYVQSNPNDVEMLDILRQRILDYSAPMQSVRRVFYLKSLDKLGVEVEPWLGAELIALQVEDRSKLPESVGNRGLTKLENSDLMMLSNSETKAAILFRESTLIAHLQSIVDSSIAVEKIRIVLETKRLGKR